MVETPRLQVAESAGIAAEAADQYVQLTQPASLLFHSTIVQVNPPLSSSWQNMFHSKMSNFSKQNSSLRPTYVLALIAAHVSDQN